MTGEALSDATKKKLAGISTATLTSLLLAHGLRNTFLQNVYRLTPGAPTMVGEAFTLRYIPSREDLDGMTVFDDREHPQRKAVETVPPGCVLVIDSRQDKRAASAGNILVTRMMMRGVAGVVTDGGLRDSPEIEALEFPVYCAGRSAPTNLIRHHAIDINVPIGCGEVPVYPGDVVVGDGEGVVVIPRHLADEVADEGTDWTIMEEFALKEIRAGKSIFGVYPPDDDTLRRFEVWKASRQRDDR